MLNHVFFSRINLLKKPLQRIAIGGTLAGAAFVISGFLELATMVSGALHLHLQIFSDELLPFQKTYEILPAATESHVNVMNSLSCDIEILLSTVENGSLGSPHQVGNTRTPEHLNTLQNHIFFQIEGRANKIIRELEPRDYRFEIRVSDDDCAQVSEFVRKFDVPQYA